MSYVSETIATVINRLNRQYFLPAIQRQFVWEPDQIVQLFDSLMRSYPISSFLFWQLEPENYDNWQVYEFVQHASQAGTHSQLANINGVQDLTLVLDGQQRLTSLLIGLKGSYTVKKRWRRWDNPDAWVRNKLYLDLLKDPTVAEDDLEIGARYGFAFLEKQPNPDAEHYWYEVGKVLNFDSQDRFDAHLDELEEKLPDTTTRAQTRLIRRNLTRLRETIWKEQVVSYYTEHDQDYDRVLDIFVRANEGGTKLSKSDLLLSMMTARWGDVSARDEITRFVEYVNTDLTRKNNFDKDFVMKACLVLSDLPVQYKVQNFNNANLTTIRNNWERIRVAISVGVDLVNTFGIDRDTLTSTNALIPVLYYLFKHPGMALRGNAAEDVKDASLVRRWLLMALLNNVFGGASDTALRDSRAALQAHMSSPSFPAVALSDALARTGRNTRFDDETINNYLSRTYGSQSAFLALSLLYDENSWGVIPHHQDHIFPQAWFNPRAMTAAGLSPDKQRRYLELRDRIANLELLMAHENEEKSDQDFATWLVTRSPGFKQRHLIPDDPALLRFDRFEDFVAAREELIRQRLNNLFAPISAPVKEAL